MPTTSSTQTGRNLTITTPLGADKLLATAFSAREGISTLFEATAEVMAKRTDVIGFDKLLGQPVTISILYPNAKDQRYFHGICNRVTQGESDLEFTSYRLEIVPQLWLLTKRTQSRTFQQLAIPDILKQVLTGFDVSFSIQGTFHPRDYCIQYRETDWDFASRLMEDEGIFYFFQHSKTGHKMVLGNTPTTHVEMQNGSKIVYKNVEQGEIGNEDLIFDFEKSQEITAGKVTLWDHCFEMPGKNLEGTAKIQQSVPVGQAEHSLVVADNGKLELYDFPGEYAQRFDGVDQGGGDRPADLQKIFDDAARTTSIRMQAEAANALRLRGSSTCRQMTAGHKFTLATDPKDPLTAPLKPSGTYVVTSVSHTARSPDFRTGSDLEFSYFNSFEAIPLALPFRPQRTTYKPVMPGATTATVVGPKGEEIFTDKYGRIKVQFHWDRQGKFDANSSCWIRVATMWAGQGWGSMSLPRIGQEVVVDFMEGDPDQPIITGSVYNAHCMPAVKLPASRMVSGAKSASYPGSAGFNEMSFDDTKGKEKITIHGQYDMNTTVEHDQTSTIHNNRTDRVDVDDSESIGNNQSLDVGVDQKMKVGSNQTEDIGSNQTLTVGSNQKITIGSNQELKVGSNQNHTIGSNRDVSVGANDGLSVGGTQTIHVTGAIKMTSDASIELTVADSGIKIEPGKITIKTGGTVHVEGGAKVEVSSAMINAEATGVHNIKGSAVNLN